jgi:hypothetical protein
MCGEEEPDKKTEVSYHLEKSLNSLKRKRWNSGHWTEQNLLQQDHKRTSIYRKKIMSIYTSLSLTFVIFNGTLD